MEWSGPETPKWRDMTPSATSKLQKHLKMEVKCPGCVRGHVVAERAT
jgi:hypothetical protein